AVTLRLKLLEYGTLVSTGGTAISGPPVAKAHVLQRRTSSTMNTLGELPVRSRRTKDEMTLLISVSLPRMPAVSEGGIWVPKVFVAGLTQSRTLSSIVEFVLTS